MPSAALILFDIDGTLMTRSGPQHREALEQAVNQVSGRLSSLAAVPTHGKLDRDLLALLLAEAGFSRRGCRAALPQTMRLAQQIYLDLAPASLVDRLCPGVAVLLESLAREKFALGVVTGNLSAIGWRKLELAGIRHFFRLGAFSEQATTRAQLARAAIRQARRLRLVSPSGPVALIGDHANDIHAAHANRIHAIATGTGLGPTEELRAAGPNLYVEDLSALRLSELARLLASPTAARTNR